MQSSARPPRRASSSRITSFADFLSTLIRDAAVAVRSWSPWQWVAVVGAAGIFAIAMVAVDMPSLHSLREWADNTGPWFAVIFIGLSATATLFPLPRTLWTVAAGVLFGPLKGVLISLIALTVSACVAMLTVRHLLGDWMAPRLNHPAVSGLNQRLAERGWWTIASLRMIAAVPFSLLNYAAGLTAVPLLPYVFATLIGSAPSTIIGVVFGDTLTGDMNPWAIGLLAALTIAGIVSLVLDSRTPLAKVKASG
ncbi:TVP38/TMEM64 family protein [Corynebacterium incognita]|uniref:TVP38/TMEM64 family membrane protein n=1 Tax=Corynebacterium incognita TaxID=2754725 RepID=A0A7G7CPR0_9CORY|nr:TVP38/TMEM64 family protein [Corynebacterium incognita]QNE89576.1 TVP38/TMEM64 family protein [Corynebacterium incognita]